MTTRNTLDIAGRTLSYLDFGGTGRPLLALHGHMSDAESFTGLAERLTGGWRLIALDQRGHGHSDRPADYTRAGYIADVVALLDHLGIDSVVLLGHSLGGVNAYQLAAQQPQRVEAIINADTAVALGLGGGNPFEFLRTLPYEAASHQQLIDEMGPFASFFGPLIRERADGSWGLPFHPLDIIESEEQVHGDHWADWLASSCPALVIRGGRGTPGTIPADQARAMVDRRPHTRLVELDTDHFVYTDDPDGFAKAVNEFLDGLR
ncbi:alpha/beta fold hydrolase [Nocardia sp. NPDC059240]|uniref:alpha/beta fold hydrolase n=1 Tax=Nocardia sp. NPDC059240 TaxID=3346786 RepID=UPI0036C76DD4